MTDFFAFGLGVGTNNRKGEWLEVFYPAPLLNPNADLAAAVKTVVGAQDGNQAIALDAAKMEALATALTEAGAEEQAAIARQLQQKQAPPGSHTAGTGLGSIQCARRLFEATPAFPPLG